VHIGSFAVPETGQSNDQVYARLEVEVDSRCEHNGTIAPATGGGPRWFLVFSDERTNRNSRALHRGIRDYSLRQALSVLSVCLVAFVRSSRNVDVVRGRGSLMRIGPRPSLP
jgi:hypothetical protein